MPPMPPVDDNLVDATTMAILNKKWKVSIERDRHSTPTVNHDASACFGYGAASYINVDICILALYLETAASSLFVVAIIIAFKAFVSPWR